MPNPDKSLITIETESFDELRDRVSQLFSEDRDQFKNRSYVFKIGGHSVEIEADCLDDFRYKIGKILGPWEELDLLSGFDDGDWGRRNVFGCLVALLESITRYKVYDLYFRYAGIDKGWREGKSDTYLVNSRHEDMAEADKMLTERAQLVLLDK